MAQSKYETTRVKVDPTIGVIDLQKVLKKHVDNAQDKDIWNILKHPTGAPFSWKTAVCIPWIAQAAYLLVDFLQVAPNCVLPAAKLRTSLKRLVVDGTEKTKKVNRTNYATDDFVDQIDSRIRILLSQVRCLKKQDEYVRAVRTATESEKARIDMVLSHVFSEKENTVGASSSGQATGLEIVPYRPPEMRSEGIFGRILAKQDSSPRPLKKASLVMGPGSPVKIWRGAAKICSPKASARAAEDPTVFGRPLMVGDLGSSSSEEGASQAAASSSSRPVRKVAPKAEALVKPLVSEAASYGLDAGDLDIMKQANLHRVVNNKKSFKKPAAAVGNSKKKHESASKAASASKPADVSKPASASKPAKGAYKCSFKKRKTSAVYHKEHTLRLRLGDSPQTAKKKARAAMAEVASKIDAGIITEHGS
ncbi:unnamed protein product [Symbiodinium sp. CCMP2592]|nr:unnamed protein product [Symbiodinium sp. CCMP2592]